MAERLCAHEPCHCEPRPGTAYCDDACERRARAGDARAGEETRCGCGHPECRPENVPAGQPSPVAQPE